MKPVLATLFDNRPSPAAIIESLEFDASHFPSELEPTFARLMAAIPGLCKRFFTGACTGVPNHPLALDVVPAELVPVVADDPSHRSTVFYEAMSGSRIMDQPEQKLKASRGFTYSRLMLSHSLPR